MSDWIETKVDVNGVTLNVLEAGEGPLVVLCHGFPELAYSWRHQIPALAAAGYKVVAPDQRGYGDSSRPEAVEDYAIEHLTDDLVALLDHYGSDRAVFVGHDWGSMVVWAMAERFPERVAGVVGMSVPFVPRMPMPPTKLFKQFIGDNFFYMLYFQEVGPADANLGADAHETMRRFLAMGEGSPEDAGKMLAPGDAGFVERLPVAKELPAWLTQEELDRYGDTFARTGFTGGINWYRNLDRNWSFMEPFQGRKLEMPSGFIGGGDDPVLVMSPPSMMDGWLTDMRINEIVPGAGHWVQQETPGPVNEALLRFVGSVGTW